VERQNGFICQHLSGLVFTYLICGICGDKRTPNYVESFSSLANLKRTYQGLWIWNICDVKSAEIKGKNILAKIFIRILN